MALRELKLNEEQFKLLKEVLQQYAFIEEKLRIIMICLGIPFQSLYTIRLDEVNRKVIYDDGEVLKQNKENE